MNAQPMSNWAGARAGLGWMAALALALTMGGCADDGSAVEPLTRAAVSGKVTLDGKPLPSGHIQFEPLSEDGGAEAGGAVKDGAYAIDAATGPVPGKYRVRISSRPTREISANEDPGPPVKAGAETVPKAYNRESKLEIEVKNNDPQTFDFELKAK